MKRRYMALFLVALLIPCCIVVPADAAVPIKYQLVNIMSDQDKYSFGTDGGFLGADGNFAWFSNANWASIEWAFETRQLLDVVFFTIECSRVPSSVHVDPDGSAASGYAKYLGSNGRYHNYSYDVVGEVGSASITLFFSSAFSGQILLFSAFGTYSNSYSINTGTLINQAMLYDPSVDHLFRDTLETVSGNLPLTSSSTYDFTRSGVDQLLHGIYYFTPNTDSVPFEYADTITFFVSSTGSIEGDIGLSLISIDDGSYIGSLPVEVTPFSIPNSSSSHWPTDSNMEWPVYLYTCTADISGYSLAKYQFSFFYEVDSVELYEDGGYSGHTSTVRNCLIYQTLETEPWYARFGSWITNGFNSVVTSINGFLNNVGLWLTNLENTVATWGKNIVDAIIPDTGQADEVIDDAESKGDELGGLNDQMGSMVKPDMSGSGDITDIISPGDLSTSTSFLAIVVNAPYIGQVVMLSLILSLAAYVLFGKRG